MGEGKVKCPEKTCNQSLWFVAERTAMLLEPNFGLVLSFILNFNYFFFNNKSLVPLIYILVETVHILYDKNTLFLRFELGIGLWNILVTIPIHEG